MKYKVKVKKKLKLILSEEDALTLVKIIDMYYKFCEELPRGANNRNSEVSLLKTIKGAIVTMDQTDRSVNCG